MHGPAYVRATHRRVAPALAALLALGGLLTGLPRLTGPLPAAAVAIVTTRYVSVGAACGSPAYTAGDYTTHSALLRAAIAAASAGDTIRLCPGTYRLTDSVAVGKALTFLGGTPADTIVERSAGSGYSFFVVTAAAEFSGMTIARAIGGTGGFGAAIRSDASPVTLRRVTLQDNTGATFGGAVYGGTGAITIVDSLVTGNSASYGGAISANGTVVVTGSLLRSNRATSEGGAIQAGGITATNDTFVENTAGSLGGAVQALTAGATITNVTFVDNTAATGGSVSVGAASTARDSLFVGGSCSGTIAAVGVNHRTAASCPGTTQTLADLRLGALSDNGGPTATIPLLVGSPAIDPAGAACATAVDQRGQARPQGSGCDVGAYEKVPEATATALTSSQTDTAYGVPFTMTASVRYGATTVTDGTVTFSDGTSGAIAGCTQLSLSTGTATCTTAALAVGTRTIRALYSGWRGYAASSDLTSHSVRWATTVDVTGATTLSTRYLQPVTFTATIDGTAGSKTGTVAFTDGVSGPIAGCSAAPVAANRATCTTSALPVGAYTITATYSGDATYAGSTDTTGHTVAIATAVATVGRNLVSTTYGQSVTFGLAVSTGDGFRVAEGMLSLSDGSDGGRTLKTCSGGEVTACTLVTADLTVGTHVLTLHYTGTSNVQSTTETTSFTVTRATLRVDADAKSITVGDAEPALTATLRLADFRNDQTAGTAGITGAASCSRVAGTAAGTYTITCGAGTLAAANYSFTTGTTALLTIVAPYTPPYVAPGTAQTITFTLPAYAFGGSRGAPFTLDGKASSGLPVTYAVSTPLTCRLSGTSLTPLAAGTCTVTASQVGNGTYAAAPNLSRSMTVLLTALPVAIAQSFTVNGEARLSVPLVVVRGTRVVMGAKLTQRLMAGRTLEVWVRLGAGAWRKVATRTVSSGLTASYAFIAGRDATYRWRFGGSGVLHDQWSGYRRVLGR